MCRAIGLPGRFPCMAADSAAGLHPGLVTDHTGKPGTRLSGGEIRPSGLKGRQQGLLQQVLGIGGTVRIPARHGHQ